MAITPGDQFEPPYVGSYNQRVHGEGRVRGRVSFIPSTQE